jgi:hypothetical protein
MHHACKHGAQRARCSPTSTALGAPSFHTARRTAPGGAARAGADDRRVFMLEDHRSSYELTMDDIRCGPTQKQRALRSPSYLGVHKAAVCVARSRPPELPFSTLLDPTRAQTPCRTAPTPLHV